jgi:hypothetical protein
MRGLQPFGRQHDRRIDEGIHPLRKCVFQLPPDHH